MLSSEHVSLSSVAEENELVTVSPDTGDSPDIKETAGCDTRASFEILETVGSDTRASLDI